MGFLEFVMDQKLTLLLVHCSKRDGTLIFDLDPDQNGLTAVLRHLEKTARPRHSKLF